MCGWAWQVTVISGYVPLYLFLTSYIIILYRPIVPSSSLLLRWFLLHSPKPIAHAARVCGEQLGQMLEASSASLLGILRPQYSHRVGPGLGTAAPRSILRAIGLRISDRPSSSLILLFSASAWPSGPIPAGDPARHTLLPGLTLITFQSTQNRSRYFHFRAAIWLVRCVDSADVQFIKASRCIVVVARRVLSLLFPRMPLFLSALCCAVLHCSLAQALLPVSRPLLSALPAGEE